MGKKTTVLPDLINCACVIHGNTYSFEYVDKLYSMLCRHFSVPVKFHVYTESNRPVPDRYFRHDLIEWPNISGPKKSWWYKLQLFDTNHFSGNLLYFDLDVVIVNQLDWLLNLDSNHFWTIHDFKRLYKKDFLGMNSSVMMWDTRQFHYIWDNIKNSDMQKITSKFRGDQDYLQTAINPGHVRYFPTKQIVSWRWQALRANNIVQNRFRPDINAGTVITHENSVLVFHGYPKPHQLCDPLIEKHWK